MKLPSIFRRAEPSVTISASVSAPDRVTAFCDWLEQFAPGTPFHHHPDYARLFGDMTMAEIDRAIVEMQRRERERP